MLNSAARSTASRYLFGQALAPITRAEDAPKRRVEFGKSDYVAPPGLVFGGAFIDRLLPIPADKMRSDVWGGDNVLPRNPDNGL